jgi:hypothetical protein
MNVLLDESSEEDLQLTELPVLEYSLERAESQTQHCCLKEAVTEEPPTTVPSIQGICSISFDYDVAIMVSAVTSSPEAIACYHHIEHIDHGVHRRKQRHTQCTEEQHTQMCDDTVALKQNMRRQHDAHVLQTTVWKNRFKTLDLSKTHAATFLSEHREREFVTIYQGLTASPRSHDLQRRSQHSHIYICDRTST